MRVEHDVGETNFVEISFSSSIPFTNPKFPSTCSIRLWSTHFSRITNKFIKFEKEEKKVMRKNDDDFHRRGNKNDYVGLLELDFSFRGKLKWGSNKV